MTVKKILVLSVFCSLLIAFIGTASAENTNGDNITPAFIGVFLGTVFIIGGVWMFSEKSTIKLADIDVTDAVLASTIPKAIKSGELPVTPFGDKTAEVIEKNGYDVRIITDHYLCIGKIDKNVFFPSRFLLNALKSKNIHLYRVEENAEFVKTKGVVEHETIHYRITEKGVLYHAHHRNGERMHSEFTSSKKQINIFTKHFEEILNKTSTSPITTKTILKELNDEKERFLIQIDGGKYKNAENKEINIFIESINNLSA